MQKKNVKLKAIRNPKSFRQQRQRANTNDF